MKTATSRLLLLTTLAVALPLCLQVTPARSQDLSVTKTVTVPSVVEGAALRYAITLTNLGPADATNARILDNMAAGNDLPRRPDQPGLLHVGHYVPILFGELRNTPRGIERHRGPGGSSLVIPEESCT